MFVVVGPLWFVLVWMIMDSGQLETPYDHTIFLSLIIPGFILIYLMGYLMGFLIQKRHAKKMQGMRS